MPITTVTNCKAFRQVPNENTEHDVELERIIPAVQEFLERECERKFEQKTVTEYFSGCEWRDLIIVARPPINSVVNLWDDPLRAYATPIPTANYVVPDVDSPDAKAGILRLDHLTFLDGLNNIKLTYSGGFTTIPLDLEQAAIEMVWAAREKGLHNLVGVRSRSIADGNVQYVNLAWGSLAEDIIRTYRLHTGVA
jgi:hypothetical protein